MAAAVGSPMQITPYEPASLQITVTTNNFEITNMMKGNVIQYDVSIEPDVKPLINRQVFQSFEDMNRSSWGTALMAYDGRKIAYSPKEMPFGAGLRTEITLPEADGRPSRKPRVFTLTIRRVSEINLYELSQFIEGKCKTSPNIHSSIMLYDILFRHQPALRYTTVGRSYYIDEQSSFTLPGGLVARQGIYQSVRPSANRMIVNHPDQLRRGLRPNDTSRLESYIKGLSFYVTHRGSSKRKYRAARFTKTDARRTTFPIGDTNQQQSVAEYFKIKYNMNLRYPELPCIEVKKNMYFPLEVCDVVENQRCSRKLTPEQTDGMIKFTTHRPDKRLNMVRDGIRELKYHHNPQLRAFGVRVDDSRPIVARARILDTPRINYNPKSREAVVTPRDGVWNLRDKILPTGAVLGSWAVLCFADRVNRGQVENFIRELGSVCHRTGMNVIAHHPPQAMRKVSAEAEHKFRAPPQIIVCILPDTSVPLYAEIKRVCETVVGVPTQCILGKHTQRPAVQYCANVCLKMNAKLGGTNVTLSREQLGFISDKPTIVIGADVSHPAPGDVTRPSIATLVGSIDANLARFSSCIRIQTARAEMIGDLRDMIVELLKAFYRNTGHKPARILFYRDGVSEGEFQQVLDTEVMAVKEACLQLEPNYSPTLTYVTVQKRHHTRLFPTRREHSDRSGNCVPGTVVDSDVTHPYEFDFFLVSHSGIQGTSRPSHYQVLYDENEFTPDSLQELTYRMCYLYARCTRSVSVVPPIYYADILAGRARFHATGDNFGDLTSQTSDSTAPSYRRLHERLRDCMFYM
ncbi:Piwi domain-containing protein [Syncephalis fuscata]|nr:Piwi domain-containing protein [Syncephalis fuscata]